MGEPTAIRELTWFAERECSAILREYSRAKRSRRHRSPLAFVGSPTRRTTAGAASYLSASVAFYLDVEIALERINRSFNPHASRLIAGYLSEGKTWRELADECRLELSEAKRIARAAMFHFLLEIRCRGVNSERCSA